MPSTYIDLEDIVDAANEYYSDGDRKAFIAVLVRWKQAPASRLSPEKLRLKNAELKELQNKLKSAEKECDEATKEFDLIESECEDAVEAVQSRFRTRMEQATKKVDDADDLTQELEEKIDDLEEYIRTGKRVS